MEELTREIIGAAVEVHRGLGPGLLESTYSGALAQEFMIRGLRFEREWPIEASYKGKSLGIGYRADFVVEAVVLVELKTVDALSQVHGAQLLSYLRHSGCRVGLLFNFNEPVLTRGMQRLINNGPTPRSSVPSA